MDFAKEVEAINVDISYECDKIWLIHHCYRTLRRPHEGAIKLKLNQQVPYDEAEFFENLHLF